MKKLLILMLLSTSSAFAQGGLFGYHTPPCHPDSHYNPEKNMCFYCPKGTSFIKQGISGGEKKCIGVPVLGMKCKVGENAHFDSKTNLCFYCQFGYSFILKKDICHKD